MDPCKQCHGTGAYQNLMTGAWDPCPNPKHWCAWCGLFIDTYAVECPHCLRIALAARIEQALALWGQLHHWAAPNGPLCGASLWRTVRPGERYGTGYVTDKADAVTCAACRERITAADFVMSQPAQWRYNDTTEQHERVKE